MTRTEVLLAGFMPSESIPSARVLPAAASPVTTGAKPALTEVPPSAPSGAPLIATAIVPELTGAPMIAASIVGQGARFARQFDASVFQRGNIHAHSNESDGDADPRAVYLWYRSHGYQFAAVTDHNVFVDPERFRDLESKDFVLLGGEEVTMRAAGKPVHINALCSSQRVLGGTFDNAERALSVGVERVVAAGGIPLINHPNFYWGIDQPALLAVRGVSLLEIYSGHPSVAGEGDEHHPSHEAMWDALLSSGQDYMGVAVDDAHHLHPNSDAQSQPGRAWIEAFAPTLERSLLCKAIMEGMLYASNGAKLERIAVSESAYDVWPAAADTSVEFVGEGGHVLATSHTKIAGERVTYRPEGRESYVRVRVMDNEGKRAWTPPVRVLSQ